jgi:hypothetical protein
LPVLASSRRTLSHRHSCVQSHDILYTALSGHPLHFRPKKQGREKPKNLP